MKKIIRVFTVVFMTSIFLVAFVIIENNFNPDNAIQVVVREDGSGTKTSFMDIVGLRKQRDPVNAII